MIKRIGLLYFSPGNTTEKICKAVALGLGSNCPQVFNMTLPQVRIKTMNDPETIIDNIDHLVIGAPVHSGKLPLQFITLLNSITGNGKKCSALVTYGNRDYGIALHSMVGILLKNDFNVTAAGAFIGQHSYSDIVPVAMGRPDESDLAKAFMFGKNSLNTYKNISLDDIPIQLDKISRSKKYTSLKPVHLAKECIKCGKCAEKCPLKLLSSDTGMYLNRSSKDLCIGCMACVKNCKMRARIAKVNPIVKLVMKHILKPAFEERKEPLTIIG